MNRYCLSYPIEEQNFEPVIIAIGYFDGVHLGHQRVIKHAYKTAKEKKLPCGIMTFNPHPKQVMEKQAKIDQITPLETKLRHFEELNVDISYIVNFTKEFAAITPKEFIEKFLLKLNVKGVIVGFDFTFGHKGLGTVETLKELSEERFFVDVIEPYYYQGEKVSSTKIRHYLLTGRVSQVKSLLGRNYSFIGKVVHGQKRGRTIDFPTANLELVEDYLDIKNGVYVVKVEYLGQAYTGVMNVGFKPTFFENKENHTYEIYLLDFNQMIYDITLGVEIIEFIREEKKFNSIDDLKRQISKDVQHAKETIANLI